MHSAILVVKMPEDQGSHAGRQTWQAFLGTIAKFEGDAALARLGENVWLANFQLSPGAFCQLVAAVELHEFRYGILPLADAPQWLPAGIDPRPK